MLKNNINFSFKRLFEVDIIKLIRYGITTLIFLCLVSLYGMEERISQQFIMTVMIMALFGFIIDNIWISAFLWWTCFLYIFFKDLAVGAVYVSNIFFGCVLYYLTKISFKKEHIKLFLNGILWLICINLVYMVIQLTGYDWIYKTPVTDYRGLRFDNIKDPSGFMGFKACMGMIMAIGIPILMNREGKIAKLGAFLLFIPLYLSQASICILAGVVGMLFSIWHRYIYSFHRKVVFILITLMMIGGAIFYALKIDDSSTSMDVRFVAWKGILSDTVIHPVTGWGLDSFRKITELKKHLYTVGTDETMKKGNMQWMDNPHNLPISLMFEWGIIGVFLLVGLCRKYILMFMKAIKDTPTITLAGILIVVFIVSLAQFPLFLARMCGILIPCAALYEVSMR